MSADFEEERTYIDMLCERLHDAYEKAAAEVGWETQHRSRKPWAEVPEQNKETMRRAVKEVLPLFGTAALTHRLQEAPEDKIGKALEARELALVRRAGKPVSFRRGVGRSG